MAIQGVNRCPLDNVMETLKSIQPPFENKIEHLREIVRNFQRGQVFLTALEFDVFTLYLMGKEIFPCPSN